MLVNKNLIRKNTEHLTSFLKRKGGDASLGGSLNGGWWQKELNPALSFMILGMVLVGVFVMGAYFMKEYIKAWNIATEKANQNIEELNYPQKYIEQESDELPSI
jgi:hypothetical protein